MTSKSHQRTARNKLLEIQKQAEDFVNDGGKWNEEERHVGRKKMRYRSGSLTFEPQADPDGPLEPTCSDTKVSRVGSLSAPIHLRSPHRCVLQEGQNLENRLQTRHSVTRHPSPASQHQEVAHNWDTTTAKNTSGGAEQQGGSH
ncbi:hypothetical protein ILYODFUR_022422 [Ilyodon furcidens]|uniref:Uncharacterized protein n=1 Tax=Ilyodon furcidens TaxID=33524 RepID=A0ABV0TAL8_9TELE